MLKDLKAFLLKANLLELAIAFIMGGALVKLVSSLVDNIVSPIIGILVGKQSFGFLSLTIGKGVITYGNFITALVDFVIVGTVAFFIAKAISH